MSAAGAAAQETPAAPGRPPVSRRPFRRLFSSAHETERTHQSLDFTTTMNEGYEDLPQPEDGTMPAGQAQMSSMLQSTLRYARQGRRLALRFDSNGNMRYYPAFQHRVTPDASGTATQDLRVGRRSSFTFSESMAWQPFRWTNHITEQTWFYTEPDAAPAVQVNDYAFDTSQRIFSYNGAALFNTMIGRAGTLALGYEFQKSTGDPSLDFNSNRAFFRFSQPIARHASLRLGYGERLAHFGPASAGTLAKDHDIDAGIDVDQPISASRRTKVRFSTGSSITSFQGRNQFFLTGSASLRQEIGRSWTAQLSYTRGVQMLEGFAAPALTDTVSVGAEGFLSPRLRLQTSVEGQVGQVAPLSARFNRYDATAALSIDVSRHASLVTRYVAQQFDPRDAAAAFLTPPFRTRGQAVRIGMTFWLDALR